MKRRKGSKGIFVDVAVLLLCLAIATSCLASGMFAKYASTSGIASEKARIASFNVSAALDKSEFDVDLAANENADQIGVALTNSSETPVYYSVTLIFTKNVKSFVTPLLGENAPDSAKENDNGVVYEWKNVGILDPKGTASPILKLTVDGTPSETEYDFQVIVTFTQVD